MKKAVYLSKTDVGNFVDWLAKQLNNESLKHNYVMPTNRRVDFAGLEDALRKYDWSFNFRNPSNGNFASGNTYSHNDTALATLSVGLNSSLLSATSSSQDQQIRDWAIAVMEWGGVRNGNVTWLQTNVTGLAAEITNVRNTLAAGNDDRAFLGGAIRRFNAGMSKIYALLVPEFIIYDSRVAAALTWLITRWCIDTKRKHVPDLLRFPCMRPKEGDNPAIRKVRNPSCGEFRFPWLYGRISHARWNLRASWILSAALNKSKQGRQTNQFFDQDQSNPLRALEAALFMWGYDLSRNSACGSQTALALDEPYDDIDEALPEGPSEGMQVALHESATRGGKAKKFKWAFEPNADRIRIERDGQETVFFETKEIFVLIHILYDHFGSDWYPLANSLTKLQDKTEKIGLGSVLHSLSMNVPHAQAASQLGVVLEEIGIFEWNEKKTNIAWRLRVEPPATIDDLRTALCGAGPEL